MFNVFRTRVSVQEADPLKVDAEGLVIPANDHLWMGSGVGGSIKKGGGEEIEIEAVQQGPAQLGQAIATGAGGLMLRRLYHAVLAGQDLKTQHEQIRPALAAALGAAARDRVACLAVAPLEDEEKLGAFHEAAREVVGALLDELGGETSLREIVLVVSSPEGQDAYRKALLDALGGG
ncbi:MAG: macro domain-containing protein [Candidatus Eisenbacteria sp.]|nr:macro domain-containing protein [Candidatus Eisenbacteria bacterium]